MLTEKDYCDKDLSATLMEMGFRGFGHFYYEKDSSKLKATHQILTTRTAKALGHTLAISLYEAQKWLREERHLHIEVRWLGNLWYEYEVKEAEGKVVAEGCASPNYEEALRTAVYMATDHLKEK